MINTIRQSINKEFLKQSISDTEVSKFKKILNCLLSNIKDAESEEKNKNDVRDFLKSLMGDSFYINTLDKDDLVIHHNEQNSDVGIIIEFKRPADKTQFSTKQNLNKKSLQQLVYYYLQERIERNNSNITKLIMTNCYEWFVFDVGVFAKIFDTPKLRNQYLKWKDRKNKNLQDSSTDWFYSNVASPVICENIEGLNDYVFFDLRDIDPNKSDRNLIPIIKFFTPEHLLCKSFANDNNSLNKNFYNELLHIIGLEEVAKNSKKIIVRLSEGERNSASLIEQILEEVDSSTIPKSVVGDTKEEKMFNAALEIAITWINRTLFIKLLEAQIAGYNKDDKYKILDINRITDYDEYNSLFFKVLAERPDDRSDKVKSRFSNVPYLNSSLFQVTPLEKTVVKISDLHINETLPIYSATILKDDKNRKLKGELTTLEYLFRFLDAYDFSSVRSSSIRRHSRDLINSSVLGLIFEKINGYKDGSFFTPSYITMYMCRETIRLTVLYKLNNHFNWTCLKFDDLKDKIDNNNYIDVNKVIDSITICDPAIGSGHFIVSALNEIITIKSELKILMDASQKRLSGYTISVDNDELIVQDNFGEVFEYNPKVQESCRIQQTLFNEKRKIIENSLFGVDINPNSVNICRLRLWIELLKSAYYKENGELETLPNIDINIKRGDSLMSKYAVNVGESILKNIDGRTNFAKKIVEYKNIVANYKRTNNKEEKNEILTQLESIKRNIFREVQLDLFGDNSAIIEAGNVYSNSMEWMIEFPEILSKEGIFLGFDTIIGNPPYGVSMKGDYRKVIVKKLDKVPDFEIYYFFIQIAHKLLSPQGLLSYIIPNSYLFNTGAKDYRLALLTKWNMLEVLDCSQFSIFESATVRNTINIWQKCNNGSTLGYKQTQNATSFAELSLRSTIYSPVDNITSMNHNWGLAFSLDKDVLLLVKKISAAKSLVEYFPEISQGLIAYDKYQGQSEELIKNRSYHYNKYSDGLKKWLWGQDVIRYKTSWNGEEYIDYCDGIANPRQPKFFNTKRILIREITNPSIFASIANDELYNDPSVIIILDNVAYSLYCLLGILNSKLATFYHFNHSPKATKGAFPKILVQDIKQFPIPEIADEIKMTMEDKVKDILKTKEIDPKADTKLLESEIDEIVYKLYNLTDEEVLVIDKKTKINEE